MSDVSYNPQHKNAVILRDVSIRLGDSQILENVNACIPFGSSTAIVGPNGAGKTSLTLAILGQVPYKGEIQFPLCKNQKKPRFGFVPQKLQFDRDMPMSVMDFLLAGTQLRPLFLGRSKKLEEKVLSMLREVECENLSERSFGALSGGEIQRVLLAQALLKDPEILILDEPTSGVDFKGGQICCELLNRIRESRCFTQLMISHDLATVAAHANHVICLNHRVVAQGEPRTVFTHHVLSTTFGLHLGIPDVCDLADNAEECQPDCPYTEQHHLHGCCHHHEKIASNAALK